MLKECSLCNKDMFNHVLLLHLKDAYPLTILGSIFCLIDLEF